MFMISFTKFPNCVVLERETYQPCKRSSTSEWLCLYAGGKEMDALLIPSKKPRSPTNPPTKRRCATEVTMVGPSKHRTKYHRRWRRLLRMVVRGMETASVNENEIWVKAAKQGLSTKASEPLVKFRR
ncbi:hypothetical protein V8G54_008478 [Vigna mungo]|uniref:Uncharacterized protein n=1 Tax=Vigna mungo TaxID=3915 RepID=A0AAQ3P5A8_VIGMU